MSNGHLTDEQIQEILDAQASGAAPFLPWHLKTCRHCTERYRGFQQLYEGLAADPGFALPPGFADSVLNRIPAPRPGLFARPFVPIALACGLGLLTLVGLAIFVDMKPLTSGSLRLVKTLPEAFRTLAAQLQPLFAWLGGSARPFVLGGLGLLSASFVDRQLRRRLMLRHNS
jgi:hypothetical protein